MYHVKWDSDMVAGSFFVGVVTDKIDDQRILCAEDGIRIKIGVALDEEMRCDWHKSCG